MIPTIRSLSSTFLCLSAIFSSLPIAMGRARIILLGDSLTQQSFSLPSGFGAYLSDVYQRRADVLNRGFSGYNTEWILEYLQTDDGLRDVFGPLDGNSPPQTSDEDCAKIPRSAVRLVTIFFGANDASDPKLNPRHHVPGVRFQANLKSIVDITRKACPHSKIIIITPPPVHHEGRLRYQIQRYGANATGELERTLDLSGQYAGSAETVAEALGVPCLNLWQEMQQCQSVKKSNRDDDNQAPTDWHKYFSDGLHFSDSGNAFVGKRLKDMIAEHFPELAVMPCPITDFHGNSASECMDLKQWGPWHDAIDYKDSSLAFQGSEP